MASLNFLDGAINNARVIVRGEAPGAVRFLLVLMATLAVWVAVSLVGVWTQSENASRTLQEGRYRTLSMLAAEYKALGGSDASRANVRGGAIDVPAVFTQVSERMELGSRVNRLAPDGRNQSVEINRLYAEEFVELAQELAARGVYFLSVEIRSLPTGKEKLLTVAAIIGPME